MPHATVFFRQNKMGSSAYGLLLLTLSLSLIRARANSELIQKTCKSTNYNDLCLSSLELDPNSSQADVAGLALIIINRGMNSSLNTTSYTSKLLRNARDPSLKKALKHCLDCYTNANAALQRSVDALASSETYDYAYLHVSAAMEYPSICHDTFRRNANLVYPVELGRRQEALQHLCDIALGIINVLLSQAQ